MNATERAKRSDELHYDNIPRRALCDRIANLESDIEDMKAENAKLQETLQRRTKQFESMTEMWVERGVDNAKLQELAQRADRLLTGLFPYIDYSRCTALEAVAEWRVRAHKLGVEVEQ